MSEAGAEREAGLTMIPSGTLATATLVGALVAAARNAFEFARQSTDDNLKHAVGDLYNASLDVKGRVLELEEENRNLRTRLAQQDQSVAPDKTKERPLFSSRTDLHLCPNCLKSTPSTSVFLIPSRGPNGGVLLSCSVCGYSLGEAS